MLQGKTAVIYGGGGAIGGAVARVFAREGAPVFLAGRTRPHLDEVAHAITSKGGSAEISVLDALDPGAVERHADEVAARAGSIDIALNAVGFTHVQGVAFGELTLTDFIHPIEAYTRTNFLTAQATARHMVRQGRGVLLMLSTPGARLTCAGFLGNSVSSAAVEALSRLLAGELGPAGVRVVCLRPHAIGEPLAHSHTKTVFSEVARREGITIEALTEGMRSTTLLKHLPTLREVAETAAFVASDRAGAMTGAVVNLSCGTLVD